MLRATFKIPRASISMLGLGSGSPSKPSTEHAQFILRPDHWREDQNHVERSEDGKFTCICGKKFLRGDVLIYHQKNCNIWIEKETNESESENGILLFSS